MCYVISSENLLANIFLFSSSSEITLEHLKNIRRKIEADVKDVYVDITSHSLLKTMEMNYLLYTWEDDKIKLIEGNKSFFTDQTINDKYNWRIPLVIRGSYTTALSSALR